MASAKLSPEEALKTVKQVASSVDALVTRTTSFQQVVQDAHERTNMPVIGQINDTAQKLEASLKMVQSAVSDILDITTKYTGNVTDIATSTDGLALIES